MYSNYYEKYMPQDQSVMTWTVKIHAIADKYDIEKLRTVTVANLGRLLNPTTNMPDYIEAIKTVDQSTGSMHGPMWKVVLENIQTNIAYLRGKPEFKELMIDMPDLIMALIGRLDGVKKVTNGGLHRDTDDDDENQDTYLGGRGAGFGRRLG